MPLWKWYKVPHRHPLAARSGRDHHALSRSVEADRQLPRGDRGLATAGGAAQEFAAANGTLECIHHALYVAVREQAGREATTSSAIIDSQQDGAKRGPRWTREVTMRARRSQSPSHYDCFVRCAQSTGQAEPSPSALAVWNVVGFCLACKPRFSATTP
jgi:hypothetical protein